MDCSHHHPAALGAVMNDFVKAIMLCRPEVFQVVVDHCEPSCIFFMCNGERLVLQESTGAGHTSVILSTNTGIRLASGPKYDQLPGMGTHEGILSDMGVLQRHVREILQSQKAAKEAAERAKVLKSLQGVVLS